MPLIPFESIPVIETNCIILRSFKIEDAEEYYNYTNNPEIIKHYDWKPNTLAEAEDDIRKLMTNFREINCVRWAMTLKDSDLIIGDCGLIFGDGKAEISYLLAKRFWGQGLMREAIKALISLTFEYPSIIRI